MRGWRDLRRRRLGKVDRGAGFAGLATARSTGELAALLIRYFGFRFLLSSKKGADNDPAFFEKKVSI